MTGPKDSVPHRHKEDEDEEHLIWIFLKVMEETKRKRMAMRP